MERSLFFSVKQNRTRIYYNILPRFPVMLSFKSLLLQRN